MKKIFLSLAALMMMTAPVMTSCSSEALDEVAPVEEVKENVVTLTIKMPEQAETRVGIDDNSLKLTGWEQNDVVKVYYVKFNEAEEKLEFSGGDEFKCTDPENGTFTGKLPEGKTLENYNVAVYGHDIEATPRLWAGFFDNKISENLKDVVFLAGPIKGGSCEMTIHNNVVKVNNNGSPVTGAWGDGNDNFMKLYCYLADDKDFAACPDDFEPSCSYEAAKPFTIPTGTSYIFMPSIKNMAVGLFTKECEPIIPVKIFDGSVGKLYKVTIGGTPSSTTGTAKATIGGSEVDVKWVQLWAGGPKFAEYNVGASSASEIGTPMIFAEASKTGDDYVWGANWCTPSKEDLEELVKAAASDGSEKVACEYTVEGGVYGFKFIGKEAGYTKNSVFLPAPNDDDDVNGDYGVVDYWSGTADDSDSDSAWDMYLRYGVDDSASVWDSFWVSDYQGEGYFLRPVLKN